MKNVRFVIRLSLLVVVAIPSTIVSIASATHHEKAPKMVAAKNEVRFLEPVNGTTVGTKFKVKMDVQGYSIGALGDMTKGKGHHHIIIDGGPIPSGQIVPMDAKHIHFGKGQTETEIELPPGPHKLTLQFANGAHFSYGPALSHTIEVNVAEKK